MLYCYISNNKIVLTKR